MKNLLLLSLLFLAGCSVSVKSDVFWPEGRGRHGGAIGDPREARTHELPLANQKTKKQNDKQAERRAKNYHGKGAGR